MQISGLNPAPLVRSKTLIRTYSAVRTELFSVVQFRPLPNFGTLFARPTHLIGQIVLDISIVFHLAANHFFGSSPRALYKTDEEGEP